MSITGRSIIKNAPRMRSSSVPKVSVNRYLDLYVLTRKRTKLELEMQALVKRKKTIEEDLNHLEVEIRKIERTVLKEDDRKSCWDIGRKSAKESIKTIVLEY